MTGYTYPEVERMTYHQVNELLDYFLDHPPAHEILAAQIGFRPRRKKKSTQYGTREELMDCVLQMGGQVEVRPHG